MEDDSYLTINSISEGLYKEKGSKFLAFAIPVGCEEEVKQHMDRLRKQYHDARHHCYAYTIGFDGSRWRMNDDGEPSGTAGRPILGQIQSYNLANVLVAVVRYFGGTKLGVSGLITAYKEASSDALHNAAVVKRYRTVPYTIRFSYEHTSDVMRFINDQELEVESQAFESDCSVNVLVPLSRVSTVLEKIPRVESLTMEPMANG